ncbi:MAG: DUF2461 domain-containing protein [Acidobacteriota bacterium]
MSDRYFGKNLFGFLEDLKANNTREWFQANKNRYVRDVKEPAQAFIADFAPHLAKVSPHFRSDPRPVGGSLFRINRDVRFSKDKSPYKTHAGLHFRHSAGKNAFTPGFYLHLEPRGCFAGVGLWHPDGPTLKKIRQRVAERPDAWKKAVEDPAFARFYTVEGDRLKRPPRGFDPDHELVEILKFKDFTGMSKLTQKQVIATGFIEEFAELCRAGGSLVRFICEALDQPY